MKIKNLFSICLLLALFVVNAQAQTASPTEGCVNLVVNFTPPAGATTFFWDFGDSNTSTIANPTNAYSSPGTYTVEFRTTAGGTPDWTTDILVYAVPEITVDAEPSSGCSPLDVLFTPTISIDPNININSLNWTFGDGSTTSTTSDAPVSHTYNTIGTFDLGLILTTGLPGCDNTLLFEDIVSTAAAFDVSFTTDPSPAIACVGPLTVNFTNTTPGLGAYTFLWDLGNGMTSSEINPPAQTYTADGTYTVTLTAEDATGCMAQTTQIVRIGPPMAEFEPEKDTICVGEVIEMLNTSEAGTYNWTFGNGAFPSTSVQQNPLVQFNEGGLIDITLTVSANGCSSTAMGTVFVDAPDPTFTSNPSYSCTNELVTTFTPNDPNHEAYLWIFHDGSTSTMVNPPVQTITNEDITIHSINGLNTYITLLTVISASGCIDTFSLVDTIWQPNALFAPDVVEGCAPLEVTFEDQSSNDVDIVLWEWDYGDGTTSSNTVTEDPVHTYTDAGEYPVQLIVTDATGCKDTSYTIVINVGEALNPDFTADQTDVCPGDTIFFSPTNFPGSEDVDAWHFETDDSRSFHCFQTDEMKWAFVSETGMFDVTLTVEYNGCFSSITKTDFINVRGPIAEIDYFIDCADTTYTVIFADSSHDATNVLWDFGDGVDSTLADLTYTYANTGSYTVYLTAFNPGTGCPASVDSAVINIRDLKADVIPLDTILCLGNMYELNSSPSIDVDDRCWRGYTWYFSDPNDRPITTSDTLVEHVFESPGFNDVRLVARDINGCLDTFDQKVEVFGVYPAFTFDDLDGNICIGQTINFTDLSMADTTIHTYEWFFDDGSTSEDKDPTQTFMSSADPNMFTVTLSVTDTLGCNGMTTISIPLYEPTSTITALPSPDICLGDVINFSATDFTSQGSSLVWEWDFGDMSPVGTNQMETVEYMAEGNYTVTLNYVEIGTNCPGDPQMLDVSVHDYPVADFSTDVDNNPLLCYNQDISFTNTSVTNWAPLNYVWTSSPTIPISPGVPNPTLTFGKGTFDFTLAVSTANGCSDTHTETFVVEGPEGTVSLNPGAICVDDEISFTLSDTIDVSKWTWFLPNGETQEGGLTIVYPYDISPPPAGGQDQIKILLEGASSACTFLDSLVFDVAETKADIEIADSVYCLGQPISYDILSFNPDNTVLWEFGDGNTSNTRAGTILYPTGGVYTVNLDVSNDNIADCTDADSKNLYIIDSIRVVEVEQLVCVGDPVVLNITGIQDYHVLTWTTEGDGDVPPPLNLSCTDCDAPIATINERVKYTLRVSDRFGSGCFDQTYTFDFSVPEGAYKLPNAFIPSVSGTTNYFNVVPNSTTNLEDLTITKFEIFNRWGQKVYDNDTPATGWDGMQNGKPAASDVYIYNIETAFEGCPSDNFTGNVTLLR